MDITQYKNFHSTFVAYSCVQNGLVGKICRFPTRRNTPVISLFLPYGATCAYKMTLWGKSRFPTRINTLLIPVITRFTAFVIVPRH